MCDAKAAPRPSAAAACAPYPLEPRIHSCGVPTPAGTAVTAAKGWSVGQSSARNASSSASCSGKSSTDIASRERRSAYAVSASVPGARPRPRSMRPGKSASRTRKASATRSGLWLGSITPPEPTRIVEVAAATWPIITSGEELAMPGLLWCSASQ